MHKNLTHSVHPIFREQATGWELWKAAYFGGMSYVRQALRSHRLENGRDFSRRLSRATLLNYLRPICDTYANYLFRPPWAIQVPAALSVMLADADRRGTGLLDFIKGLTPLTAAVGFSLIGVDEPTVSEGVAPANLAEREAMGVRPYFYFIDPLDLRDWETDGEGRLVFALVRERRNGRQFSGAEIAGRTHEVFRLWTPEECRVIDGDGNVLARFENRVGEVPIVPLQFRDVGDPIIGQGLGQDLEPVQAHILNVASLLSEISYRQTFSQLVAEGSAEEYGENGDIARLGTASIFLYPEGRKAPGYISPDASQAQMLMNEIDRSIDEIYRLANLTRGSVREGRQASGISKAFDFLDTNQALSDVGRNVTQTMQKLLTLAARWAGASESEVAVAPPADYGIVDLDGDISRLKDLVDAGADPSLLVALQHRIAATMFPTGEAAKESEVSR